MSSRRSRSRLHQKRQDDPQAQVPQEGETMTISVQTQTLEVDAGGGSFPTASSILDDPTGGTGELKLAMMWETTSEFDTEIGKMTEKCLIPADDPSQKFCETLLNGEILGGEGISVAPAESSSPSAEVSQTAVEQPTATATEGGIATTSSASVDSESGSASSTDSPPTTLSEIPSSTITESP
ncbi:hypothetical protein I302_101915 [Kwoniella bestiolae CBS 10118]|uniref:Uncharacterized protein n=1 Tax=Kwoniella bestiolae CBS 10118 TaxID=1296100 RepID=A0A1B9GDN0_9TREE|nr:hypothetical protein I302_00597 [Kwoniella bestiolae CBS 10118]OCF29103.1 hypothetical protein I302_00597 [Kwoniella bestiolae CBS 10118]